MKTILVIILAASLVSAPYTVVVNAKSSPSGLPPIEQPLVREGEFAVELAAALHLTSSHDEAAADCSLASIDITPRNGWISDYPMTPDIIAEVRDSAAGSAYSGNLQISGTDAAGIVDKVSIAMNLPIKAAGEKYSYESSSEYQSPPEVSEYVGPYAVDDYYYDNEPPIVTYYPPPVEYAYLYDWVPDPFWWNGFGFGGFFILVDFDRHHDKHHITNHAANANGTVSRINATTRAGARQQRGKPGQGQAQQTRNATKLYIFRVCARCRQDHARYGQLLVQSPIEPRGRFRVSDVQQRSVSAFLHRRRVWRRLRRRWRYGRLPWRWWTSLKTV